MDKEIIVRNFSRYANLYDRYADVQRRAGVELLSQINGKCTFNKILEIGCGTGNYTLLLREKFKNAKIKALDICSEMVGIARQKLKDMGAEFIVADAEDANLGESFDFITSNACFQWFEDLEKSLMKYNGLLKENGAILFSIFGPSTFSELNVSLRCVSKNVSVEANNFITKEKIEKILNKNFKGIKIKESIYQESFLRLKDLLCKIKYSGIRGSGTNGRIQFTNRILKDLEELYLHKFSATNRGGSANHFGGKAIKATYQIFFCKGEKR